jgi:glutamate mutase epsilon subunit
LLQSDKERDRMGQPRTGKEETLQYIQEMLEQLGAMARAEKCDMLAYLIEMACIEASDMTHGEHAAEAGSGLSADRQKRHGST